MPWRAVSDGLAVTERRALCRKPNVNVHVAAVMFRFAAAAGEELLLAFWLPSDEAGEPPVLADLKALVTEGKRRYRVDRDQAITD